MSPAQYLLTITVPMLAKGHHGRLLAEAITRDLEPFGNPAAPHIRAALDKTQCIHFMSLSAIAPSRPKDPAYFIIEATGDGKREDVIAAIDSAIGDHLFPIVARACGLADRRDLSSWMRKHSKRLSGRTPIGSRISGRAFAGIEDFTVPEILGHAQIADLAKAEARSAAQPTGRFGAIEIRDAVLAAIDKKNSNLGDMVRARQGAPAPGYVDRPHSPWIKAAVRRLQRNFFGDGPGRATKILRAMPVIIWWIAAFIYVVCVWLLIVAFGDGLGLPQELGGPKILSNPIELLFGMMNWLSQFLVPLFLAVVPTIIISAALIYAFLSTLRHKEKTNTPDDSDPDPALVAELLKRENPPDPDGQGQWAQNHMIAITELQPGFFRRYLALPFALRLLKRVIKAGDNRKGFLGDMGTVHFARWLVPPGTNKFVFYSNYDGSWESYFEDFIVKAADGVTAAWSSSKGFPETRFMLGKGATDGDRFKRFARRAMVPSPFWYTAYPHLTAEQIRKNGLLVHGLANISSASFAEAWLAMIGSRPRVEAEVEREEIQSLAFGNSANLTKSRVYALRFEAKSLVPDEEGGAGSDVPDTPLQRWLLSLRNDTLNFGRKKPDECAHYLGVSMTALEKLGLSVKPDKRRSDSEEQAVEIDGLPGAFVHGMHHPGRQRSLSDPDAKTWSWGGSEGEVDAVLLMYWEDDSVGSALHAEHLKAFAQHGITIVKQIETHLAFYPPGGGSGSTSPKVKPFAVDPFGFADGISQPKVRGITRLGEHPGSVHDVEPGEFVLGYRDNLGYFPSTPTVAAADDTKNLLASKPEQLPLHWPDHGGDEDQGSKRRDFGRNGTFLVIRQLYQNVEKFNDFFDPASPTARTVLGKNAGNTHPDWLKSRVVGRWPNGSSTVLHPHQPGDLSSDEKIKRDNEFLFGQEDSQGKSCPLGAHIRRANPRDSLNPQNPDELTVSNRHRILRRGRTYTVEQDSGYTETGTMFMCLNANIERQFEFIQQTWLNGEAFHGLDGERDPIAASSGGPASNPPNKAFDYSIPTAQGTDYLRGLSAFVELRGGGYFFMPSRRSISFLCYL